MGNEGCLPLMPILDMDIVVSPLDIKLGEVFCILEFIDEVRDERERRGVLDGMLIQVAVILAGMKFPFFFLMKKKGKA